MKEQIRESFKMIFDVYPNGIYFAPGRVNLIGEHTDYNGGNVFPCALEIGTYGAIRERKDSIIRMYSENFKENGIIEIDIKKINYNKQDDWANYPKGVIRIFQDCGHIIQSGFDILFSGNIPNGAGLSSSASIEILMAIILKDIFELEINMIEMVKLCQKAENSFVGVNSGIMDQFAVGMGKKDHAILLDTNTLDYRYALIRMDGISIVISNTNKKRGLQDSKYNERRNQCDEALRRLQKRLDIQTLGELTEEVFESNKHLIEDEVLIKRAKHAVLENLRTLKAVKLLEKGDIDGFGQLMIESHMSLKDDYEVTGRELDKLVEITLKQPGVIGSRMTGAGFGGCTVTLVRSDKVLNLIRNVGEEYINDIGYQAEFYVVKIGEGAHRIM